MSKFRELLMAYNDLRDENQSLSDQLNEALNEVDRIRGLLDQANDAWIAMRLSNKALETDSPDT